MARDLLPRKFTEQDEEAANEGETLPEKQPLLGGPPQAAETGAAKSAPMLAWASAVIMASTCLINYNKVVMQPGNFPFAVPLVMLHSFCGTMFALILLLVRPSFFPSLTDPDKKVTIDFEYILRSTSPVALCFTASLVLSNTAYQFASVAFLQMLKQGNVILVFGFSLMAGLEVLRLRSVLLICGILAATGLTVKGEMNSSVVGLFVQLSCCIFESAKIVIQGILLSGTGKKLDPMSYLLIISPQCFLLLSGVVACHTKQFWLKSGSLILSLRTVRTKFRKASYIVEMAQRTRTQQAARVVCLAAAAAALASVAAPLFTGGFSAANSAQSRAPAQVALRGFQEFQEFEEFEEPAGAAESLASGFRAFGCAAVLAVALLAQGANAQEREGIPSGNAKGDPNLQYSSLLPNKGGKSLLAELGDESFGKAAYGSPTTFDKVAYGETKEEKKFAEKYAKNKWTKADKDKVTLASK